MANLSLRSLLCKKIANVTTKFNVELTRPHQKNLREILTGLITADESFLSLIGEAVGNKTRPRKYTEKLSRALGKIDAEVFHKIHILSTAKALATEPVLLIVDGGDLQKPYAKKMGLVGPACDGSAGHEAGHGYPNTGDPGLRSHEQTKHPSRAPRLLLIGGRLQRLLD
jgi:hypothetical protein